MVQQTFSGVPGDRSPGDVLPATDLDKLREWILALVTDGTEATGVGNVLPLTLDATAGEQWSVGSAGQFQNRNLALSTDNGVVLGVTAEAQARFVARADGQLTWGGGTLVRDTNLYRSAADVLKTDDAFDAGSVKVGGTELVTTNRRVRAAAAGTVSDPGYAFDSTTDAGMYLAATDEVGFATEGVERFRINSVGIVMATTARIRTQNGSLSNPGFQFASAADGFYHDDANSQIVASVNSTARFVFGTGALSPATTANRDLGSASAEWRDIYLTNAPTVSSDVRRKDNVRTSPLGLEFLRSLDTIAWERDGSTHVGLSAQNVHARLTAVGFPTSGLVPQGPDGQLGLRQMELIGPIVAALDELAGRVETLEAARG